MDLSTAPLPVVHLRVGRALQVHPEAPAREWRRALLAGGLLSDPGVATADPDDPRAWLRALQELVDELDNLEQHMAGLRSRDDQPRWAETPLWMWALVAALPVAAITFGWLVGSTYEDRLLGALFVYVLPASVSIGILVFAYSRAGVRRQLRRRELVRLTQERATLRQGLAEGCAALGARSAVARAGGRLLLLTGDLDWLRAQASAARRQGNTALKEALETEAANLEDDVMKAIHEHPQEWSAAGELADRAGWTARVQAGG
jgi:hypothetical protein